MLDPGTTSAEAAIRAKDADVVIIGYLPFGAAEIAALSTPRLLIRAGIGYDMVDIDAATASSSVSRSAS